MHHDEPLDQFDKLLDYHLDRLEADERVRVEARLQADASLRASSRRLGEVLSPLDSWSAPASPNLVDNVLRAVERSRRLRALADQPELQVVGAGGSESGGGRGFLFSGRELLAAAACILMVFSLLVPGIRKVRRDAWQAQCGANMHGVHQGLASYQDMSTASLPFMPGISGAAWLPGGAAARERPTQSNSRHMFRLLKFRLVPGAESFICPEDGATPMDGQAIERSEDFSDFSNNSYDSVNMAGGFPPVDPPPSAVYLSDHNPLFVAGRFDDRIDPDQANSPNHGGRGQNVLRLDGSVEWLTSPVLERVGDNLWLMGNRREYDGTETLDDPSDGWMIPGFPKGAAPAGNAGYRKP